MPLELDTEYKADGLKIKGFGYRVLTWRISRMNKEC